MPTFTIDQLQRTMSTILQKVGAPTDHADEVADVLADNHLAGHDSHGILRIPQYVEAVRRGEIDPVARPEILERTDTTALVTGHQTFGQVTANFGADLATEMALEHRVAAVSLVETPHTGRLAAFTERGARRGVMLFMASGTGSRPLVAPYGGREAALGTNPIAFSFPNADGPPVTLDFATAATAAGKVRVAQARGQELPEGALLTADGRPTTDPHEWDRGGVLLPFAGHKGYALAVMADLFSGPLAAADAWEMVDGRRTGAFIFAIAVDTFRTRAEYDASLASVADRLTRVPPAEGFDRVRLPGEPEGDARVHRSAHGVDVPDRTWQRIVDLAAELEVHLEEPRG